MSDRDKLAKLAEEAELNRQRERDEAEWKKKEAAAAVERQKAENKTRTDELLAYCRDTFAGFKLVPSGHEVTVSTSLASKLHKITSDHEPYVSLSISHFGEETGNFEGDIPFLLCRYHNGAYEIARGAGTKQTTGYNLDGFKEELLKTVGRMGKEDLLELFRQLKQVVGRR